MVDIGVGHLTRALQLGGFGHEEIIALQEAAVSGDFSNVNFCRDTFTDDWEDGLLKFRLNAPVNNIGGV